MKVVFLRHAEGTHNVKGRINQDLKILVHLTSKGKKQAVEAGKKLEGIDFNVIFSSEFVRARETAEIVNRNQMVQIFPDRRINEAGIGFEGEAIEDFRQSSGGNFFNFKLKGKESWQDVKKRVANFLVFLKKEKYESVLVVEHEWVVKIANQIVNDLTDEEAYAVKIKNCDFLEFEI